MRRTRLLPVSAIHTSPLALAATPAGAFEQRADGGAVVAGRAGGPGAAQQRDVRSRDQPDAVPGRVRHDHAPGAVDGDAGGAAQRHRGRGTGEAARRARAAAGDLAHGRAHDLAHAVVGRVGDVDVAAAVEGDAARRAQRDGGRRSREGARRVAGPAAGNLAERRTHDLADAVVPGVGDVDVAARVHRDSAWRVEAHRRRSTGEGARGRGPATGVLRDRRAGDLADAVVAGVGDVDVAAAVDGDTARRVERDGSRGTGEAAHRVARAAAGDRRDDPGARGHLPDPVVRGVGDVDVAAAVDGDGAGRAELGRGRGRAVAREPGGGPGHQVDRGDAGVARDLSGVGARPVAVLGDRDVVAQRRRGRRVVGEGRRGLAGRRPDVGGVRAARRVAAVDRVAGREGG